MAACTGQGGGGGGSKARGPAGPGSHSREGRRVHTLRLQGSRPEVTRSPNGFSLSPPPFPGAPGRAHFLGLGWGEGSEGEGAAGILPRPQRAPRGAWGRFPASERGVCMRTDIPGAEQRAEPRAGILHFALSWPRVNHRSHLQRPQKIEILGDGAPITGASGPGWGTLLARTAGAPGSPARGGRPRPSPPDAPCEPLPTPVLVLRPPDRGSPFPCRFSRSWEATTRSGLTGHLCQGPNESGKGPGGPIGR